MKTLTTLLLTATFIFLTQKIFSQTFEYISPKDNSILVSLNTNIILKSDENINPKSLSPEEFNVQGTSSGTHSGIVKLSDDNKTILFVPSTPFSANETVSVAVSSGIKTTNGQSLPSATFHFKTTPLTQSININPLTLINNGSVYKSITTNHLYRLIAKTLGTDTLPSDFPQIKVDSVNNPADGKIFLANFSVTANDSIGNYIMILNNDGSVVKYLKLNQPAFDFKVQPNGELSYADVIDNYTSYAKVRWIVMDTSLTPVDTFQCGNGYYADLHDFELLPNGHALLFAFDPEPFDMSPYGGDPNATVIGVVVQELDASKNVVFQWRSWDYLPIKDSYQDLTTQTVDLIHANAIDVDNDGNFLLSMRHLSSIIKIDRQTGNIDWILGGKQNQFTFLNEDDSNSPNYFSYQHDVHVLPDGDITLFDNGNQHNPPYSRAVEYKLDEQNKTADMVWEYRPSPDIFNFAMGSVQRLSNGNTIIGWGYASADGAPAITEVHQDNTTALKLYLPAGQVSYRAFKFPWVSEKPIANNTFYDILQGNTYPSNLTTDTCGIIITFNQINSNLYTKVVVTKYNYAPLNPAFNEEAPVLVSNYFNLSNLGITSYSGDVKVNLKYFPAITNPKETIVYTRSGQGNIFTALPTSYDSVNNELDFTDTTFGDFAFGIPQTVSSDAPVPISPKDSEIVNGTAPVNLVWGTRGVVKNYRIQVSNDSSFNNIVVDNSNLTSTSFTLNTLKDNTTYFWRVNNTNSGGTSNWSAVYTFFTSSPFINILSIDNDSDLYEDSTYIIRWQTNVDDTVRIELLQNNNVVDKIVDSLTSATHAYLWKVPPTLEQDSSYQIKISSLNNNELSSLSEKSFTILSSISNVEQANNIIKDYKLSQNYPNPFNPSTQIEYSIPQESRVRIDIFNAIGQRVKTLVNSTQSQGNYSVSWNATGYASGVYFYAIKAIGDSGQNFYTVKKMILLK